MLTNFATEFVTELFLDDNVSTINRLIVATANVVNDNFENVSCISNVLYNEKKFFTTPILNSKPKNLIRRRFYFEKSVKCFSESVYFEKFKMCRSTVQALIILLKEYVRPGSSVVPLDKKIHVFLWLLVSEHSFKEAGEKFDLPKSSVSYIFHEIANLLAELKQQFINWPSVEEQHVIRVKVNSRYGFPNCVGFIDACRLKVGSKRRSRSKEEFVLLQAVCDDTLMLTDIHIGEVGNTRKSKVFRDSILGQEITSCVDFNNHILGDSDYKLKINLITPYIQNELLTDEEMRFNEIHWRAHICIGQAFDLLRKRFRKINHIDVTKPEALKSTVYAACVLHNFVLLHEGSPVKEEIVLNDEGVTIDPDVVTSPEEKREFLCNYINFMQNE